MNQKKKSENGILYEIGVGPGDPELLTLKAVRLIRESDVIVVPGRDFRDSVAYQIAREAVPELSSKQCLAVEMPMTKEKAVLEQSHGQAADTIIRLLAQGKQVAFLNLGDVTVYASCLYVHRLVRQAGYQAELVNGIPSFCAAAAALGEGLAEGEEQIHVLARPEQIEAGLQFPGTKIIMKMGRNLKQVKHWIREAGQQAALVEKCGMEGEQIRRNLDEISGEESYYSLVIVKDRKQRRPEETRGSMGNRIYVVGIGPGGRLQMTGEARQALEASDVIVGYTVYVDLVRGEFPDKEYVTSPMRQEEARCRRAFEEAGKGRTAAVVCSGDAGVYGMAGLMLELALEYPDCQVEVVAGVTAALAGGAVLGAPLMHDFAVISLSDLMTPWETIEKRLRCAAAGDFVICIYNPSSRTRAGYLKRACEIVLEETGGQERVCGTVSRIGREGQCAGIMSLRGLMESQTDMFTTVFIGNAGTREIDGRMVTPRGYSI